jgi:hypothetical protein
MEHGDILTKLEAELHNALEGLEVLVREAIANYELGGAVRPLLERQLNLITVIRETPDPELD